MRKRRETISDRIRNIKSLVDKFKPIAEEISKVKLDDLVVNTVIDERSKAALLYEPDTILINLRYKDKSFFSDLSMLSLVVAHELGHHIEYTINPVLLEEEEELDIIAEGFAEYFCLDLLPNGTLSKEIVSKYRNELLEHDNTSYGVGYRFFRKVTNSLGKEEALRIIRRPDLKLYELKTPVIYIAKRKIERLFE